MVEADNPLPGRYIVVLKDGVQASSSPSAIRRSSASLAEKYRGTLRSTYVAALHGFSVRDLSESDAQRLAADTAVRTVYEDGTARAVDTQSPATWGIDRLDQKTLPLDNSYTYNNTGSGATVYVMDTGIKTGNPEYEGRASVGKDFVGGQGADCHGHGSHVAGTIASKTYGVAKKAKVVALKVLGGDCSANGPDSGIIDAVDWVTANGAKPGVVNMSLRMDQAGVGDEALKKSVAAGFSYVVAAGNENQSACNVSPARVPEAITVGATDNSDNKSSFSNHGSCLDIFAPGSNVVSLGLSDGGTATMSGTSMASPHVAGAAAQYLTANPAATPQQVRDALVNGASDGVVKNPGTGSPNKLLNVSFIGGGGPGPDPDPGCTTKTNGDDVSIPDAGAAVTSTISVADCTGTAPATLPVKVEIPHSYTADLAIELIGPSGTEYQLQKARGVSEANGVHRTFTVTLAENEQLNGDWKLRVTDVYKFDIGKIDSWTLTIGTTTNAANYEGDTVPTSAGGTVQFYNGEDATVSEYPAIIAGIRAGGSRPQGQSCSGSVVAPRKVLIAAHCADAAGEKSFLYGLDDLNSTGGFRTKVLEYKKHPKYVNFDQGYDVAVVTVADDIPVPGGAYAKFATSADTGSWKVGDNGLGFGYGKKDHDDASKDVTLDKATLPIVDGASKCLGVGAGFKAATMICAGYSDGQVTILPGDSGGPLLVNDKIVGLASWSRSDFRWYSIYARLDNDMGDWVKQEIGDTTPPPPTGDFGVAVEPSTVSVAPGKYISTTVTTQSGTEDTDLTLSASGLPSGARATFQPATVNTGNNAKVTFETTSSTPAGNHTVTITGTSADGKTATARVTLSVTGTPPPSGDVKVTTSRASQTVQQGQLASTRVTALGGTGRLTISASGAPAGSQVYYNPPTVDQGGTSEVWIFTNFQTPPGTYPITIKATSADGKVGTATFTITVTRFG